MFIRVTKKENGKKSVRLMKSVQVGGKPKQKTVCSFGVFSSEAEVKKVCELSYRLIEDFLAIGSDVHIRSIQKTRPYFNLTPCEGFYTSESKLLKSRYEFLVFLLIKTPTV